MEAPAAFTTIINYCNPAIRLQACGNLPEVSHPVRNMMTDITQEHQVQLFRTKRETFPFSQYSNDVGITLFFCITFQKFKEFAVRIYSENLPVFTYQFSKTER